jgi:hypothetical protein
MKAMGIEPPPPPGAIVPGMGALSPAQLGAGRPTDVNVSPTPPMPRMPEGAAPGGGVVPTPPVPGGVPAPGGVVPVPPVPGGVPAPGGASNVPPPDPQQRGTPPGA